jgi:hypothetical protein
MRWERYPKKSRPRGERNGRVEVVRATMGGNFRQSETYIT